MSKENKAITKTEIDGFDGYESGCEGDEDSYAGSLIAGTIRLGFDNGQWFKAVSKEPMPAGLELTLVDVLRAVVRFKGKGQPPEQQVLGPGEKWPDLKAKNDAVPKSEWQTGFNRELVGPYQAQHILRFLDEKTLDRYSWPSPVTTKGSKLCVQDVTTKIRWKRKLCGEHVLPVVLLSDTFMSTQYAGPGGGRQRPHLIVLCWIRLGAGSQLPAQPEPKQLPGPAAEPVPSKAQPADNWKPPESVTKAVVESKAVEPKATQTVEAPSLGEQMNDEIPSDGDPDASGLKASVSPTKKGASKIRQTAPTKTDALAEILDDK